MSQKPESQEAVDTTYGFSTKNEQDKSSGTKKTNRDWHFLVDNVAHFYMQGCSMQSDAE